MPRGVGTAPEVRQEEKLPMRMGPPPADALSRMEEVLDWIWWLDDEDERRLVWLRAGRVIWKRICWRLGCGRTKAWQMWTYALLKIVTRLNAKKGGR